MIRSNSLLSILAIVASAFLSWYQSATAVAQSKPLAQPNIILILADDFGVGDIQAHYPKNKIATPNLDQLVRQGRSFFDAHSPSAVCSPTRYGILTGRYAWRTRLQEWVIAAYEPPLIEKDRLTLPGFLQTQGYHTSCIGKWHLGWSWQGAQPAKMTKIRNGQKHLKWDFTKAIPNGPIDRGFDEFFGVDLPNLPPFTWLRGDRVAVQPTEAYVNNPSVQDFMPKGFAGCPVAPNWRLDEILPEITRQAVRQVHELAQKDQPFFLYFSQTSPHEPVSPSKAFQGKSGIAPIADFVMETDWSVGQVVQAVDEAGIANDTLIIFTADNGHSHYTGWQTLIKAGHQPSGPYRGHKGDIWEGGHRVPLVVRWPGSVPANTVSDRLVSLTDIFATCVDVVGTAMPENQVEDSISFYPTMVGAVGEDPRPAIVNHSNHGEFALRRGDWKLVLRNQGALASSRGKQRVMELYNLSVDVGEQNNLIELKKDQAQGMFEELKALVDRGATRRVTSARNDGEVDVQVTQKKRWANRLP